MNLNLFHNNKNYTHMMNDLASEAKVIELEEGAIEIGFHKQVGNIYIELTSRLDEEGVLVEDEIDLKSVTSSGDIELSIDDETLGLVRPGFIRWDQSKLKKTNKNGIDAYWVKLSTKTEAALAVNGINLVLSSDKDLESFFPDIKRLLPEGKSSFIGFHQQAMKTIVQKLRNSGMLIKDYEKLKTKQVDQFDLLQIDEFREASKFLTLSYIFSWLYRDDGDNWHDKKLDAQKDFEEAFASRLVPSIDLNNNGKADEPEMNQIAFIRIKNV